MAWRLQRPLITVSCHDDLTASGLVGGYLVKGGETIWVDGPLTQAARAGGICYLDEIVEARKDTMVVIHPLADDRRVLPMEKLGSLLEATSEFCLAISYNPGYQSVLKDLKQSTRQRFVALDFDYPVADLEASIVVRESGLDRDSAARLVRFAEMTHNLKGHGLEEGASTLLWARSRYGTFRAGLVDALREAASDKHLLALFQAMEMLRLEARIADRLPGLYRELQRLKQAMGEPPLPAH